MFGDNTQFVWASSKFPKQNEEKQFAWRGWFTFLLFRDFLKCFFTEWGRVAMRSWDRFMRTSVFMLAFSQVASMCREKVALDATEGDSIGQAVIFK